MDSGEEDYMDWEVPSVMPYQIIGQVVACATVLIAIYLYCTHSFHFFEKKGIYFLKPQMLLGNLGPRINSKTSFHEFQLELYNQLKGNPYGGVFEGRRPVLYVLDPELINALMVRDSQHFVDRTSMESREPRYLTRSLANLKGRDWKAVRLILASVFDSASISDMIPLLQTCNDRLVQDLSSFGDKDVQMKDVMDNFTLQVIGACAFGYGVSDCENAHFVNEAKRYKTLTPAKKAILFFLFIFAPGLAKYFNVSFVNLETSEELVRMLKVAKTKRRNSEIRKCDFVQLFIEASETERLYEETSESSSRKIYLDEDTINAQCLQFIIDGYETSSSLLVFAIHTLATHSDLQNKLRREIQAVTSGKEISYEFLSELTYLEAFLLETLRMYPPVSRICRVCTKEYILPETSVKFSIGDMFAIPTYAIHMDPLYYPEPEKFRPERFKGEKKKERPPHLFLPFGAGPRNCIGQQFVMLMAKLTLVALLKRYKFSSCPETKNPMKFEKRGIILQADGGVMVHIKAL